VAAIAVAALVSLVLPYDRDTRLAILLAGLPLLFGMLNTSFVAVLQARLRMERAVVGDVVGRAVALAALGVVVALDLGFFAVMGTAAAGALATAIVTVLLTRRLVPLRPRSEPRVWRRLLVMALPLGVALAVNELYFRADTLIISLYEPYDQVGLYTLAYRIVELTLVFGTVFLTTTFPLLSRAVDDDEPRARRTIQLSTELFVALGAPLVAGGLALAPEIVELAAGSDFEDAATPLRILLASGALAWVNGVFGYALIAKDRQLSALWLNVSALVFNVVLNLVLVPVYGIVVAAVVTVSSEVLILAGSYVLMRRYFGFFPFPRTLVPALLAAAVMGGVLWVLRDVPVVLLVPFGAALYGGLMWLTSPASRELVAGVRA
jgi:O-antigen/teichoic acid export membrane protein